MRSVAGVLKALIVLNIVCFFLFVLILGASYAVEGTIVTALAEDSPGEDPAKVLLTLRIFMVVAALMIPLAHLLLTRLRAIITTVQEGDPFVAANARRLTGIAWALLGIQIVDLGFGIVAITSSIDAIAGWTFTLTGWLAALLLFVLARVFEHGARMRDELAATI
jgi:Ca2+/Na+ antiporter